MKPLKNMETLWKTEVKILVISINKIIVVEIEIKASIFEKELSRSKLSC